MIATCETCRTVTDTDFCTKYVIGILCPLCANTYEKILSIDEKTAMTMIDLMHKNNAWVTDMTFLNE